MKLSEEVQSKPAVAAKVPAATRVYGRSATTTDSKSKVQETSVTNIQNAKADAKTDSTKLDTSKSVQAATTAFSAAVKNKKIESIPVNTEIKKQAKSPFSKTATLVSVTVTDSSPKADEKPRSSKMKDTSPLKGRKIIKASLQTETGRKSPSKGKFTEKSIKIGKWTMYCLATNIQIFN